MPKSYKAFDIPSERFRDCLSRSRFLELPAHTDTLDPGEIIVVVEDGCGVLGLMTAECPLWGRCPGFGQEDRSGDFSSGSLGRAIARWRLRQTGGEGARKRPGLHLNDPIPTIGGGASKPQVIVELAEHYLARSSISAGEIAFLLWFQDSNSFLRAFRGWTGTTPGEFRGAHSENDGRLH